MPISDMPIFSMLRTRMQWHQERQRVLAENVANADTPRFRPHDLKPLDFGQAQVPAGDAARSRSPAPTRRTSAAAGGSGSLRDRAARTNTTCAPPATR